MPVPELQPTLIPNHSPNGGISCALEQPVYALTHYITHTLSSNRLSAIYFLQEKPTLRELLHKHLVEGQFWEAF